MLPVLWIVLLKPLRYSLTCICPVSCAPYVANFSGLSLWLPLRYSLSFICPVFWVPYVATFSGLSCFIAPLVFSNMYLSYVLYIICCQFLLIFIFTAPSVFSNIHLSCVLCTLCCKFLCIVLFFCPFGIHYNLFVLYFGYHMLPHFMDCHVSLTLLYSLTFIYPVSWVPYVASLIGFSYLLPLVYSLTFSYPVSYEPDADAGLSIFITSSVFSNNYLSCFLCILCCQFLRIVLFHYPFGII